MAAPLGNKNGEKGKKWEEAIRRALARDSGSVASGLDRIADKIVAQAAEGNMWAIGHIADRIDGKPKEHVQVDNNINVNLGESDSLEAKIRARLPQPVLAPLSKPTH